MSVVIFLLSASTVVGMPECVPRDSVRLRMFNEDYNKLKGSQKPNITANSRSCMRWRDFAVDEMSPYEQDDSAVCQTFEPYGSEVGPWCFVGYDAETAVNGLWDPCYPRCDDLDRRCFWYKDVPLMDSRLYLGRINTTETGLECASWAQVSQARPFDLDMRLNHSECRAFPLPDEIGYDPNLHRPWCFFQAGVEYHWAYCHPLCEHLATCLRALDAAVMPYSGLRNTTVNGHDCLDWNAKYIKWHPYPIFHQDGNFCRNKGRLQSGPWCLTTDQEVLAEPCFPHCEDEESLPPCVGEDKMINYVGTRRATMTGLTCQRWDKVHPHTHHYARQHFKVKYLWEVSNFCRNPNADPRGPWCFTTDPTVRQEFCFRICSETAPNISLTDEEYEQLQEINSFQKKGLSEGLHPVFQQVKNIAIFTGLILLVYFCVPKCQRAASTSVQRDREIRTYTAYSDAKSAIRKQLGWVKSLAPYDTPYKRQSLRSYFMLLEEYRQLRNFERNTQMEEGVMRDEEEERQELLRIQREEEIE